MAIRERLVYAIDVVTDGATKGLSNFRSAVAQADTTTGKFKAGASSAFDTVKANAGVLAVSAGTALAAFGAKAVSAFQETAIEAGKFSDATGLAVEDASRWIEVAGDVGVSAQTIEGAFVKMNKSIAAGGPAVEKYGLSLIKAADGTADVNATMLNAIRTIGAIQDPTERATAAQEVFGRSYKEAAEIIFANADQVKAKLDQVSDAKVIDESELEKARRFREAMDNVQDVVEDLTLIIGEGMVPALSDVAETATDIRNTFGSIPKAPWLVQKWWDTASPLAWQRHVIDGYDKVGSTIKGWFGGAGKATNDIEVTTAAEMAYAAAVDQAAAVVVGAIDAEEEHADAVDEARQALINKAEILEVDAVLAKKNADAQEEAARATDRMRRAAKLNADAIRDQTEAVLASLDTMFDYEKATIDAADSIDAYREAIASGESSLRELQGLQIETVESVRQQAQAFAGSKGAIEGSTASIHLQIQEFERMQGVVPELAGQIQQYIDKLNSIPSVRSTQLVVTSSGAVTTKQTIGAGGRLVAGAEGAIVTRPTGALIGEAGPEAVIPLDRMPGASPLPGGIGGGSYTINVYANGDVVPDKIVDAIKKFERLNGNSWRS